MPRPTHLHINGAKNALLPLLFSCPLINETVTLTNAPVDLFDYKGAERILKRLGFEIVEAQNTISLTNHKPGGHVNIEPALSMQTRCSIYLLGSMAKKAHSINIGFPGGCSFGKDRNFDIHLQGLQALNARIEVSNGNLNLTHVQDRDAAFTLPFASVGATTNLLLYATIGSAAVTLYNCAVEPEVMNLVAFLNACGARISCDPIRRTFHIEGVSSLNGCSYPIIYDRIQVMTYICLALMHRQHVTITGVDDLELISYPLAILSAAGASFNFDPVRAILTVDGSRYGDLDGMQIETAPYPYFPTDLHPIYAVLALCARRPSEIHEQVIPERKKYIAELNRLGAHISPCGNRIHISPASTLHGASMTSTDLRGGMACIMGASLASGSSRLANAEQVCRGYDNLIMNLSPFMHISTLDNPASATTLVKP